MSGVKQEMVELLGQYGHIGGTLVFSIFLGLGGGILIDRKVFDGSTSPWFTFIGLAFGIFAGFKPLYVLMKRAQSQ